MLYIGFISFFILLQTNGGFHNSYISILGNLCKSYCYYGIKIFKRTLGWALDCLKIYWLTTNYLSTPALEKSLMHLPKCL